MSLNAHQTEAPPFTIPEFAERAKVSRSYLYKAWDSGCGPERVKVGRRTLITETPVDWLKRTAATA